MIEGKIKGKVKTVNEIFKDNMPFDLALRYAKLDLGTYKKYNKKLQ